jgi:hypothetical protein
MSDIPFSRTTPPALRHEAPPRRWGGARLLAIGGFLLTSLACAGSVFWLWTLTVGAPTGWRLRVLLPNALVIVPCALGFALAAFSPISWHRRIGWGLVVVTLLAEMLLTWYWLPSHA